MNPVSPPTARGTIYSIAEPEEQEDFDDYAYDDTTQSDFTIRSVVVGLLVGVILCMTNIYFGLQTGWVSMMSLQSALLGYAIFAFLPRFLPRLFSAPFTPQENVILQTTAVATGTMPLAAGLVGIIPALGMLNEKLDGMAAVVLGYWDLVLWCLAVAFFGVFLAAPLRRQVIVKEKLVFPSGTATAQLIALLHKIPPPSQDAISGSQRQSAYRRVARQSRSLSPPGHNSVDDEETLRNEAAGTSYGKSGEDDIGGSGWRALGWSFLASGSMTLLSYLFPILFALPIFDILSLPFGTSLASSWLWYFTPSLSYIGQGIIMGFPVTVSMNAGMLVGWAILSPLSKKMGWAPGPVRSSTDGARGWILWVALAIMIAESIISLIPITASYVRKIVSHRAQSSHSKVFSQDEPLSPRHSNVTQTDDYYDPPDQDEEEEHEPLSRLVPIAWVQWGLGGSAVLGVFLVWWVFGSEGIHPWATAIGLVLASVLSIVGVRALGETDLNPVSGIGKISQLLFAVLQPGNVVANIIAGGVAEAGAQQAGDLMQDLKTGHLLHASPRSQFYGQMIGSLASVFVSTAGYRFYTSVYQIPGPEFAVPSAGIWLSLARLLNNGHLPEKSVVFMVIFGFIFSIVAFLKAFKKQIAKRYPSMERFIPYLPSGIAFAIGFLNAPSFSLARLIGGYIAYASAKRAGTSETPLKVIVLASGFVLGEGVVSILTLSLKAAGVGAVSCWGCGLGDGGYCSSGCA